MASNRKAKPKAAPQVSQELAAIHCPHCAKLVRLVAVRSDPTARVAAVPAPVRQAGTTLRPVHLGPPPSMAELAALIPGELRYRVVLCPCPLYERAGCEAFNDQEGTLPQNALCRFARVRSMAKAPISCRTPSRSSTQAPNERLDAGFEFRGRGSVGEGRRSGGLLEDQPLGDQPIQRLSCRLRTDSEDLRQFRYGRGLSLVLMQVEKRAKLLEGEHAAPAADAAPVRGHWSRGSLARAALRRPRLRGETAARPR